MDDAVHSASAMGGGLAFSYISEKAGEMLPGAAGKYAPVGFALLLTGAMGLTARRSMALRAFFLGGIGSLATDQARKLGYQAPVTAMEGMGRVSSAQRIASILGTIYLNQRSVIALAPNLYKDSPHCFTITVSEHR